MASKLFKPKLFSQVYKISPVKLDGAGLLDPIINGDTKLFIDPLLINKSAHPVLSTEGVKMFRERMSGLVGLLENTAGPGDAAWKGALSLMNLHERSETCLGYGGKDNSGRDAPESLKLAILTTAKQIVDIGVKNPELIAWMGMFEEGVGSDTISDLTTNTILRVLEQITAEFCNSNSIPLRRFVLEHEEYHLPANPLKNDKGILLVPKDVLRELPVAADWSDIDRVVSHNATLRHMVNQLVGNIAKATITQKKSALKSIVLSDPKRFQQLVKELLDNDPQGYDFETDRKGFEALRQVLLTTARDYPLKLEKPKAKNIGELQKVVREITEKFKHLVENGDLSELLWHKNTPRPERTSQKVFYGIADSYCEANDVDISPEINAGGGPVDFKFSSGYSAKILVELKLSSGSVVHGYEKQLEIYKGASQTDEGVFVVVNVGKMGSKLTKIKKIQAERRAAGKKASEIIVIDATKKKSASKR